MPFVVSVCDVVLSPARAADARHQGGLQQGGLQQGGLQQGGGGFALCIAYGDQRYFGASVELEASDLAVDERDIELWDGTRPRYTPLACMLHPLSVPSLTPPLLAPSRHALPPSGRLLPLPAASARPGPREEHDLR